MRRRCFNESPLECFRLVCKFISLLYITNFILLGLKHELLVFLFAEFFDLSFLEGETIREWLFFDKPRRAFDTGNRKQRSLPDYSGRGWHESRKQVMKEHGGHKRSYYMDPQPLSYLEWHLYEYEINNQDGCALYRLELKLVDKKKSPKGKVTKESLNDLQNKMGKLTAAVPSPDDGKSVKGKSEAKSENIGVPEN